MSLGLDVKIYDNNSGIQLFNDGNLYNSDGKSLIQNYNEIKKEELEFIKNYLKGLRKYWNKRNRKISYRTKLKSKLDFNKLTDFLSNLTILFF